MKIQGVDHLKKAVEAKNPLILAVWHDNLFLVPELLQVYPELTFGVLISKSRDGDVPSAFAEKFKNINVIRVGHNIRHHALSQMVTRLEAGDIVGITPDGPRGPRHKMKPGIFFAAKKANAQIICVRWSASKVWKLKSWDKFKIPKPFAKITLHITEAVNMDHVNSAEELEPLIKALL